jgi:uncharacterized protein YndB with AHSA1/START domain
MTAPTYSLDRTILIRARPEVVFSFFADSARWASWWGPGSTIDPRPGGAVRIRYPGGVEAAGEVRAIAPPRRIEFTYGFVSGQPIPSGTSLVTITLASEPGGTRLSLVHTFDDAGVRDQHVQGWRYQLAVFGNVVADALHADAAARVDAWYAAWNDPDPASRTRALEAIASPDLRFRDRHGLTDGIADLVPHIGAAQRFMPGLTLARDGDARH